MKYIYLGLLYLLAILPLPVLYGISQLIKFLLGDVFKYRSEVILKNLQQAFPDKNVKEINQIKKEFYKYYTEVFIESVKLLCLRKKKLLKMISIRNNTAYSKLISENKGAIILTGHRGNFELAGQYLSLVLPHSFYGAYKPFKSKNFEYLWSKIRHNFKMKYIPAKQVSRFLLKHAKEGLCLAFLNDQSPTFGDQHCWLEFLNKEAIFFTGPEKLAKKLNLPVYFMDMIRIKRGQYEIIVEEIQPKEEENGITNAYVKLLEQVIQQNPSGWLWSHQRWKKEKKIVND